MCGRLGAADLRERLVPVGLVPCCRLLRPLAPHRGGQFHSHSGCLKTSESRQPLAFGRFFQAFFQRFCFTFHRRLSLETRALNVKKDRLNPKIQAAQFPERRARRLDRS